jgi:hypothetical protein
MGNQIIIHFNACIRQVTLEFRLILMSDYTFELTKYQEDYLGILMTLCLPLNQILSHGINRPKLIFALVRSSFWSLLISGVTHLILQIYQSAYRSSYETIKNASFHNHIGDHFDYRLFC